MRYLLCLWGVLWLYSLSGQSISHSRIGSDRDTAVQALGGVCLMGGGRENDQAMRWFLRQANGGDITVLRTTGGNAYNTYLFEELGVPVNSVETIRVPSREAAGASYLLQRVAQAEALWIAGGDQWEYISFWKNTALDSLIRYLLQEKNLVIGGSSAGMAVLGGGRFTAERGTIRSAEALADPFHPLLTVSRDTFFTPPFLQGTITDTHFDNPDRKGRTVAFLARAHHDWGDAWRAIACDEFTAVTINPEGIARVFGDHPDYNDNAYFLQLNCHNPEPGPETIEPGKPLHWDRDEDALRVYQVKGTPDGNNYLDLRDWTTGEGGAWQRWFVENGILRIRNSSAPSCTPTPTGSALRFPASFQLAVNPLRGNTLHLLGPVEKITAIRLFDPQGRRLRSLKATDARIPVPSLPPGLYFLQIEASGKTHWLPFMR